MLMLVYVEWEIWLLGRNFYFFQDGLGENECVMELEGFEVVVEVWVECELFLDIQCYVICQQYQFGYEVLQLEFCVGLFLCWVGCLCVDSVEGLYVVLYDCFVGYGDCSCC